MLAVGTKSGEVHLYDTVKQVKIRTLLGHSLRVGTLSWGGHNLASGSRDRTILIRDHRASDVYTSRLTAHKQEVRYAPSEYLEIPPCLLMVHARLGMRITMVVRRQAAGVRGERQQVADLECVIHDACREVRRTFSSS